jgi:hypothetical protein
MSLAIGIGGGNPTSGGGGDTLNDPSSFADAIALYRSDAGITLVGDKVDAWADQSGSGYDAAAAFAANRLLQVPNKGKYDFKDIWMLNSNRFETSTWRSGTYSELSVDFAVTPSDQGYWFCIGDGNNSNAAFFIFISTNNILVYHKIGGTLKYQYYPHNTIIGQLIKSMGGSSGGVWGSTLPEPDTLKLIIPSWSGAAKGILGYLGIWDRALTGDEIAANQTWKENIWS